MSPKRDIDQNVKQNRIELLLKQKRSPQIRLRSVNNKKIRDRSIASSLISQLEIY